MTEAERLHAVRDYIAAEMQRPYEKGVTDCGGTIDRWVRQIAGVSPVSAFGRQLRNAEDTAEWVAVPQMFAVLVNRAARAGGFKKTKTPIAGDVGLIFTDKGVMAPAIHAGDSWFTRHDTGAIAVPIDRFWKAWSV
ncbi:hypothetical protein FJW07_14150 [Mesorhizobium sp. B3-1-9]|uniref:DUF6950 family protein n=1 Tax=Mesorhizobium sp. B3-1-9 TaxID=2589892 RepID=UPI00112C4F2D|nr:hypothetical protein [Mesorhizobium sp. B3-1-9]TPI39316.1 hypothetical protein FJW07_14150 [Mesorhizobium sp. B3-1-9]